jgi:serine/threonine protein kinase
MGTEFYTAPEKCVNHRKTQITVQTFISLGVAIYRLLSRTGYPEGAYPPLHQLNPALPPEIDRLIDACLQVDRDRRLNNAADVDDALAVIERQMQ